MHDLLRKYWGYRKLRSAQENVIRAVMQGKDVLAILPTGYGKSILYQLPALMAPPGSVTVVVSPLIALMEDQVQGLRRRKIPARCIHSGLSRREQEQIWRELTEGRLRLLYLAPERLLQPAVLDRLRQVRIHLLAVDEAHCISEWGEDFRPAYRELRRLREEETSWRWVPFLAVSATAPPAVEKEIVQSLCFRTGWVRVRVPSWRRELQLVVRVSGNWQELLRKECEKLQEGSGIVYVGKRREAEILASWLRSRQISAEPYHAGMSVTQRQEVYHRWMKGKTRIVVATSAFGMGVDKPDVRLVVHLYLPPSLEAYWQEAGRAGRDRKPSRVLLLLSPDRWKEEVYRRRETLPDARDVVRVFHWLWVWSGGKTHTWMSLPEDVWIQMLQDLQISPFRGWHCLQVLHRAGVLHFEKQTTIPARVRFLLPPAQLYRIRVEHPHLDPLIQVLFQHAPDIQKSQGFVDIQEVARSLRVHPTAVESELIRMCERGWVEYEPARSGMGIEWLVRDPDEVSEPRIQSVLHRYRERALHRLAEMEEYIRLSWTSPDQDFPCRMRYIVRHLDGTSQGSCEHCDLCQYRQWLESASRKMLDWLNRIQKNRESRFFLLETILKQFPPHRHHLILDILKWLHRQRKIWMKEHHIYLR